jgi:biopolymer transport protein ExbB/biopolymer transport protein TolQ
MTVTDGGQPRRIDVPVELPEGMRRQAAFGANKTNQMTTQYGDASQAFDWSSMGIWRHMNTVTKVTMLMLLIMSIWSIVITIERYLTFSAARNESREFATKLASSIKSRKIDDAIGLSNKYKNSHLAIVVNSGLQRFRDHQLSDDIAGDDINASICALQRATASKIAQFRRGLSGLAAIRSTAPLVGLSGTMFGIIYTFEGLSETYNYGVAVVASDIAEALVTTAIGFALRIPAAWLLNYFTNRVENFAVEMDNSSAELINFFLKQRGKKYA